MLGDADDTDGFGKTTSTTTCLRSTTVASDGGDFL
jgi:hypothetical protein